MWRRLAPVVLLLFCASTAFGFNSNMPGGSISGGTCTGGQFMTGITAGGAPVCGTPSGGAPYPPGSPPQIGGFATLNTSEAQTVVGDFTFARTGTAQLTATVTKLNGITPGGTCTGSQFVNVISGSGVPTCAALPAPAAGSITDAMLTGAYSGVGVCSAGTFASTLNRNAAPTCTAPNLSGQTFNNATFTGSVTLPAASIADAALASAYSGVGTCTGGQFVSTLNRNAAPTCTTPAGAFTAGGDLSGTSSSQTVIGIRSTSVPALAAGYLHYNGAAFVWDTPGGGFAAGGDLSGSASSQTVIGIRSTSVPVLATGYLYYNGSAFVWQTPAGGGTVTSITAGTGLTGGTIINSGTIALATPVSIANGGRGSSIAPSIGQIDVASSTTAFTPVSMSNDCTITSAGAITCTKTNGTAFSALATAATPLSVANGGTGTSTAPSAGQLLIAQSGTAFAPIAISGDATLSSAGVITVTKINGVSGPFLPLAGGTMTGQITMTGPSTINFPSTGRITGNFSGSPRSTRFAFQDDGTAGGGLTNVGILPPTTNASAYFTIYMTPDIDNSAYLQAFVIASPPSVGFASNAFGTGTVQPFSITVGATSVAAFGNGTAGSNGINLLSGTYMVNGVNFGGSCGGGSAVTSISSAVIPTCTAFAASASPTFSGTMTFPDGSTYTSAGHNNMKALGIGQAVGADPLDITGNFNGNTAISMVNTSAGVNASTMVQVYNGTYASNMQETGTGWTGNPNIGANTGVFSSNSVNGVDIISFDNVTTAPIRVWANGGFQAIFGGAQNGAQFNYPVGIEMAPSSSPAILLQGQYNGNVNTAIEIANGSAGASATTTFYLSNDLNHYGSVQVASSTNTSTGFGGDMMNIGTNGANGITMFTSATSAPINLDINATKKFQVNNNGAQVSGQLQTVANPATQVNVDATPTVVTITNTNNTVLPVCSGLVIVTDETVTGGTCVFATGGSASTVVAGTKANCSVATAPPANTFSLPYYGPSSSYLIINNLGATATFGVFNICTRAAN